MFFPHIKGLLNFLPFFAATVSSQSESDSFSGFVSFGTWGLLGRKYELIVLFAIVHKSYVNSLSSRPSPRANTHWPAFFFFCSRLLSPSFEVNVSWQTSSFAHYRQLVGWSVEQFVSNKKYLIKQNKTKKPGKVTGRACASRWKIYSHWL